MIRPSFSGQQPEQMLSDPKPVLYREVRRIPLRALRQAVQTIGDTPGVHSFERFVVYHGIPARHFA
jgi:hypothetical protein